MDTRAKRRRSDSDDHPLQMTALVVDDDPDCCLRVAATLRGLGIASVTETSASDARELIRTRAFDLAVLDLKMGEVSGLDLMAEIRRSPVGVDMHCTLLTGHDTLETRVRALRDGFDDVIGKSVTPEELTARLLAAKRIVSRQRKLDLALTELRAVANQDPLTGLFNRRLLFDELERLVSRGSANLNLILFDLNDFKSVNDTQGHVFGDRVLREVAAVFLRDTRDYDLVGRYGGDEFLLLIENASIDEAGRVAGRLADEIAALRWTAGEKTYSVSASWGIANSSFLDNPSAVRLLEACDSDLYASKFMRNRGPDNFSYDYEKKDGVVTPIAEVQGPGQGPTANGDIPAVNPVLPRQILKP